MGRRRRGYRVPVAALLAVPVVVTGSAYLASNTVQPSHAGTTAIPVSFPTSLQAGPPAVVGASEEGAVVEVTGLSATLSYADGPLAGETVTFRAGGGSCTGQTDPSGSASCDITGLASRPASYTATFDGADAFDRSTTTGTIRAATSG